MPDPITAIRLETHYRIGSGPVHATVFVGEAQRGTWSLSVDGVDIERGKAPKRVEVGRGASLAGKTLTIEVMVTDTNPFTNHTSVLITIEGGSEGKSSHLQHTVSEEGRSVFYVAQYELEAEVV